MLLRLANLGVTNALAMLRLLPMSDHAKDVEILALPPRHDLRAPLRRVSAVPQPDLRCPCDDLPADLDHDAPVSDRTAETRCSIMVRTRPRCGIQGSPEDSAGPAALPAVGGTGRNPTHH